MKKLFLSVIVVLLALSPAVPSFAESYVLQGSGISFSLPSSWKPADSMIGTMFTSPAEDMVIFFGETEGEEAFENAMDMVAEVAEEAVSDLELDDGTEFDINGIKAIEFSGSGTSDGTDVFVSVVLMAGKGECLAFMVSIGEEDAMDIHESTFSNLVNSLSMEEGASGSGKKEFKPAPRQGST
ncbi:MAG: hypothetical protein PHS90_04450 [Synergistaceae bacterium]|nr:hypothetical protein [Synergistaceae bacterium]